VNQLTLHRVADSLTMLLSPQKKRAAADISAVLLKEDGVSGAAEAFYRRLPLQSMLCDVSIYMGEARLAQVCYMITTTTTQKKEGVKIVNRYCQESILK
jgi:hypothetical protein